ncbi:hypothetical protein [Marivita sp. XM-24bin2]|uniref:hypothetical protein n=1 Tax=unclassified Marivita TaxID=2632480 RepID=UPI000D7B625C|nr:hypothetical protein [Marivita sp. XM-24bin2]PWL34405.1 MAG: hypothetical protein DCO97_14695 [Marivita sp. XM-24bin2]
MSTKTESSKRPPFLRPIGIVVTVVGLAALAIWQIGPVPFSKTNPYLDDLSQNPTGAGSSPSGAAAVIDDGVVVERDAGTVIDGSADATDLTGISNPDAPNTVSDEGRRTLSPADVVEPGSGTVSNETGTVQAQDDSS